MDFVKKAQEKLSGNKTENTNASGSSGSAGKEDYGDKGMDFAEKKMGMNMSREQNEKISDGARGFYEKQTGSKVSDKFSN